MQEERVEQEVCDTGLNGRQPGSLLRRTKKRVKRSPYRESGASDFRMAAVDPGARVLVVRR
jgi:hypothetical protein